MRISANQCASILTSAKDKQSGQSHLDFQCHYASRRRRHFRSESRIGLRPFVEAVHNWLYVIRLTDAGHVAARLDIARARPPLAQLAATMALEHFTAAFAHRLLADPDLLKGASADLARLWRWHAIEEIEHKGVAYDVFLHAARDLSPLKRWRIRRWAMCLTTLLFTRTVLGDRVALRFSIGARNTTLDHVRAAWRLLQELAT